MRFFKLFLFVMFVSFCSCKQANEKCNSSRLELESMIKSFEERESYDKEKYPLGIYTREFYKDEANYAEKQMQYFDCIDMNELSETERISAQLLKFVLQDKIDFYKFERFLNPLLSDSGFHSSLNYEIRPITSHKVAKQYLNKLNAIPEFVKQHFKNLREGLEKGVSQPKVIFKGYESTYNVHIANDYRKSPFYKPFNNLPSSLSKIQKDSVLEAAKELIELKVVPEFKKIKSFFELEYLPKTRTSLGISETPNGLAYYQNRINFYTTSTKYTADDIHKIGLAEVSRIKAEMQKIIKELNFKGDFSEFLLFLRTNEQFYAKTPNELLMNARDMAKRADAQLPKFFKILPRKPYGVSPVPEAIAPKYTGGRYIPPSNETNPGYYWVNTYDLPSRTLYTLPSLTVHEAVPGHHLQMARNSELGDSIPKFRRDLYLSAYGEGWGLYSEYLADEMEMYTTPYEQFGKYTYEMWRACRLVVDTGIHAKGWSRKKVVDFMSENTALSIHEINTETDRYISWPGQALSYKIGELKIRELRNKAELKLKDKFDIRDFHEVILEQGTVTLSILEERVNNYIKIVLNE